MSLEVAIIGCIGLNSKAVLGQNSCRSWETAAVWEMA